MIVACRNLTIAFVAMASLGASIAAPTVNAAELRNGLSFNGLSFNGLSFNGLSFNGLSFNGLSFNGVSSTGQRVGDSSSNAWDEAPRIVLGSGETVLLK